MHKKRKMKSIVKLLLVLIIIGGVGFFLYNNYSPKNTPSKDTKKIIDNSEIDKTIFKDYQKQAAELVSNMSLGEKVGQLFLVRYNKNDVDYLSNFIPGGYILFAKDFENHTKESIKKELDYAQNKNKYPLIIGVDEEGGYVTRVSRFKNFRDERFQSPKSYYQQGGWSLLEETEKEKATLLKEIGINLNLAPVADVSTNEDDFMYIRAFGEDATKTSEYIKNMVGYANNNKINSCLKHFPGYGNNEDTHTGIAIDNRSYETFENSDYLPFKAGIEANVPSILVSHNIVKCMDENLPASLSEKVIKELREKLGFTGIIMTDDLAMDAVKAYVDNNEAATMAINAGNDMIITSDFVPMYKEIVNSIKEGKIKEETIDKAVTRIIAWKYYSNLF